MFKFLKNNKAQVSLGEYLLVIVIVGATLAAMGTYFRRGLQAKIFDAHEYVVDEVVDRTDGNFTGRIYYQFEPHYTRSQTEVNIDIDQTRRHLEGGIYRREMNDKTQIGSISYTAPPEEVAEEGFNDVPAPPSTGPDYDIDAALPNPPLDPASDINAAAPNPPVDPPVDDIDAAAPNPPVDPPSNP